MALTNMTTMRRQLKNVAYNFSDAQVKVREATSNDPWGPSSSLMSEVADLTYNAMAFSDIMQMIWKRLNDHGKNWRHVYKSLVLLDYLIKTGSDKVAQQCKENIYAIQTLKDFQHIEDNKDQGMNVREKAKQLVSLLKDDERLKNERARALMAKKRFAQNSMGISSDGSVHSHDRDEIAFPSMDPTSTSSRHRRDSELEEARPTSSGEEELQLQIALALSKEEADKEQELKRGDDVRLAMALNESKDDFDKNKGGMREQQQRSTMDDLLSLQPPMAAAAPIHSDPWAGGGAFGGGGAQNDPWGAPIAAPPRFPAAAAPAAAAMDPWGTPVPAVNPPAASDPWAPEPMGAVGGSGLQHNGALETPPPAYAMATGGGDAWNFDPMLPTTDNGHGSQNGLSNGKVDRSKTKTPENFLGENSSLVNLDNLMGPSKRSVPGMPPSSVKTSNSNSNPFATGAATGGSTNPFLAQRRPSPTLNEMRAKTTGPTATSSTPGDWSLPTPLQPSRPDSANNPFA